MGKLKLDAKGELQMKCSWALAGLIGVLGLMVAAWYFEWQPDKAKQRAEQRANWIWFDEILVLPL
jgi:hypothetical protein